MPNTINSKKDLQFAGKWLSSVFQSGPLLTRKKKWKIKEAQYKRDIYNLKNSTTNQELQKAKKTLTKSQQALNDTFDLLDISKLSELSNLLQGRTLRELVLENRQLKNSDEQRIITNLENKVADQKGELSIIRKEKENLLKSQDKLTDQIKTANYQIEALIKNIEKGLVKGENNILTQIMVIQSLLSYE